MPFDPVTTRKQPGDLLTSADWNDLVDEATRLGAAKVNRTGDTFSGPLTVAGALAVGSAVASADVSAHIRSGSTYQLRLSQTSNTDWARLSLNANGNEWVLSVGAPGSGTPNQLNLFSTSANRNVLQAATGGLTVNGSLTVAGSDLYFTQTDHSHTGVGNTLGFAAIENADSHDALMILGRTVATSPLRRVVKLWDYLEVNGDLHVTGAISSPRFDARRVIDQPGALPIQTTFASRGGLLLFFCGGSGFSPVSRQIGMRVLLNGTEIGQMRSFTNEPNSHKAFVSEVMLRDDVPSGTQTLRLEPLDGTATDGNDFFTITALELPFNQFNPIIFDPIRPGRPGGGLIG